MSDFKVTKDDLHHLPELIKWLDENEGPSFLVVVMLTGFALVCLLLVAVLVLGIASTGILPNTQKPDYTPTSMLVMPAPQTPGGHGIRA